MLILRLILLSTKFLRNSAQNDFARFANERLVTQQHEQILPLWNVRTREPIEGFPWSFFEIDRLSAADVTRILSALDIDDLVMEPGWDKRTLKVACGVHHLGL